MKKLVVLTGPTAVGKTDLSIQLAKAINGEIISADSVQVYKYMDIGSAKITKEEMNGVKHYLIDILNPDDEFNVNIFKKMTLQAMDEIYAKGKIPIIVGGTGFYIQSVLYDIQFEETNNLYEYRLELEKLAESKGNKYIHDLLTKVDPVSAKEIHFNNRKRVIRALEYYKETGNPISEHNALQRQNSSPYNFVYFVLNDKRELLYERINNRVDIMVNDGLVEEVKSLINKGYNSNLVSMQGIGYKEIIDYLDGNIDLDEAIDLIKKNTRHFAKRQLTWFRREKEVTWVDYDKINYNKTQLLENMLTILRDKGIIND